MNTTTIDPATIGHVFVQPLTNTIQIVTADKRVAAEMRYEALASGLGNDRAALAETDWELAHGGTWGWASDANGAEYRGHPVVLASTQPEVGETPVAPFVIEGQQVATSPITMCRLACGCVDTFEGHAITVDTVVVCADRACEHTFVRVADVFRTERV